MKKTLLISFAASAILAASSFFSLWAEGDVEKAAEKGKKACHGALEKGKKEGMSSDITLEGKIEKKETGKAKKTVKYVLVDKDGAETVLPETKEGDANAIDLEKFVGKDVKLTGKGMTKEHKGKTKCMVKEITAIEEVKAEEPKPEEKK